MLNELCSNRLQHDLNNGSNVHAFFLLLLEEYENRGCGFGCSERSSLGQHSGLDLVAFAQFAGDTSIVSALTILA